MTASSHAAGGEEASPPRSRRRAVIGGIVIVAVVVAAGVTIFGERHEFSTTLRRVGVWPMVASLGLGLVGTGATGAVWGSVLGGLGVRLPWRTTARVFFVTQLGKYLPGSVWPVLMQMEAGRSHGASRRTMLAGNLITLTLSCAVGLLVACAVLPFYEPGALVHYWWVLLALPLLLGLLAPRALPFLLDRVFLLARRRPLGERISAAAEARAGGWALLAYLAYGAHIAVLCLALAPGSTKLWILCIGGISLAIPAGVLFIPAPAGAGIRDIILKLILGVVVGAGPALAVVVASRVILLAADVVLAGLGAAIGRRPAPAPAAPNAAS